jgi:hypothetical protein
VFWDLTGRISGPAGLETLRLAERMASVEA